MKTIRRGDKGPPVDIWQGVLNAGAKPTTWVNAAGVTRSWPSTWAWPLAVDADFGQRTEWATEAWQRARGLVADAIVGPKTWSATGTTTPSPAPSPRFPFVQAKHFRRASRTAIDLVVIHTMEYPERVQSAEWCADFFRDPHGPNGPVVASAHYSIDSDSIVQSVLEKDVAYHAGPVNEVSVGIEHAGYAGQSATEWLDPYSTAMLNRSAELVADICRRYSIPVRRLTADDLRRGERRGICGHVDVTMGLQGGKGHTDPGAHFPWGWYLSLVRSHVRQAASAPVVVTPERALSGDPALDFARFVEVEHAGVRWQVCPIYVAPVGIGQAVDLAARAGCELPTPALVDAIWRAADLRIDAGAMERTDHDGTPRTMDAAAMHASQAARLAGLVGDRRFRLLAGSHKDVVTHEGRVGLYGWHRSDGRVIQPFYARHAASWRDYSQALRLVRRVT